MLRNLLQEKWRDVTVRGVNRIRQPRSRSETLILFFNTMWDQPIDPDGVELPSGCHLTADIRRFADAAAVVFHIPSLREVPAHKPQGQLWVAWSMECEVNYPQLRDPGFMRQFDLTMTYRLDADVVAAYTSYYGDVANLQRALRTRPAPKAGDKLATLFISSGLNR